MIRLTGIRKSYRTGSSTLEVLKGSSAAAPSGLGDLDSVRARLGG
jgi:hypothetical protein